MRRAALFNHSSNLLLSKLEIIRSSVILLLQLAFKPIGFIGRVAIKRQPLIRELLNFFIGMRKDSGDELGLHCRFTPVVYKSLRS